MRQKRVPLSKIEFKLARTLSRILEGMSKKRQTNKKYTDKLKRKGKDRSS
jgi:hypothetical protein